MKVYIYKKAHKNSGRERVNTLENVREVKEREYYFAVVTNTLEVFKYDKDKFMLTVYGY